MRRARPPQNIVGNVGSMLPELNPWYALDILAPAFRFLDRAACMILPQPPADSVQHPRPSSTTTSTTHVLRHSQSFSSSSSSLSSSSSTSMKSTMMMNSITMPSVRPSEHHAALDLLVSRLRAKSVFHPHGFYPNGFGPIEVLPELASNMEQIRIQLRQVQEATRRADLDEATSIHSTVSGPGKPTAAGTTPTTITTTTPEANYQRQQSQQQRRQDIKHAIQAIIPSIDVRLSNSSSITAFSTGRGFSKVQEGSFVSPAYHPVMPPECAVARFQLITPLSWGKAKRKEKVDRKKHTITAEEEEEQMVPITSISEAQEKVCEEMSSHRPIVVLLAGTGEQGFHRRRHCVAYPLAKLGIASLILESAYYGARRPPAQHGSKLSTLMDLPLLGRSTIEEARCLVKWLQSRKTVIVTDGMGDDGGGENESGNAGGSISGMGSEAQRREDQNTTNAANIQGIASAAVAAAHGRRFDNGCDTRASEGTSSSSSSLGSSSTNNNTSFEGYGSIVLAGTSMGGLHAAMAASLLPNHQISNSSLRSDVDNSNNNNSPIHQNAFFAPVGVASWLGPPSAAPVFTKGALAFGTDWEGLCKDIADPVVSTSIEKYLQQMEAILECNEEGVDCHSTSQPSSSSSSSSSSLSSPEIRKRPHSLLPSEEDIKALAAQCKDIPAQNLALAQRQAARLLRLTDITNFTCPSRPDAVVFVTALQDQYIPFDDDANRLWDYIKETWPGCDVRAVRGGHVTASLFALDTYAGTVVEIIRKLRDGSKNGAGSRREG